VPLFKVTLLEKKERVGGLATVLAAVVGQKKCSKQRTRAAEEMDASKEKDKRRRKSHKRQHGRKSSASTAVSEGGAAAGPASSRGAAGDRAEGPSGDLSLFTAKGVPQCRGRNRKKRSQCANAALMEFVGPQPLYCAEHISQDPESLV
jgi:hypothetical protein